MTELFLLSPPAASNNIAIFCQHPCFEASDWTINFGLPCDTFLNAQSKFLIHHAKLDFNSLSIHVIASKSPFDLRRASILAFSSLR